MKNKEILTFVVLSLLLIVVGFVARPKGPQSETILYNSKESKEGAIQPPVDAFVGQSAKEVTDPQKGTVKQSSGEKPLEPEAYGSLCSGDESQNFDCYEKYFQELVENKGIKEAFSDLRARYSGNFYIQSQCHPLTHVIGRVAVGKYPKVSDAYAQGDSFCWSGYYHGVLEGVIGKIGRQNLASQLDTICSDIPGKAGYSFDYYNCVHGLGHGVMAYTQNELFDGLKLCDNVKGNWEQSSCYSGVFMENVIVDNKNHFTKYLKPSDPIYPCNAVGEKYKYTCYLMQTSYMLKITKQDFSKVFELCSQVDADYTATCYQSLGRDASGHSISNVESTKNTCNLGKDFEQKSNCIIGAVKDFISYYHSDTQAKQLCMSLSEDLQGICMSTAESYYKVF